jgi:hypothetical protein
MTRAQLQAIVWDALDNGKANGWDPCPVSVAVIVANLKDLCADLEQISERRIGPAVTAWLSARCPITGVLTTEDQRKVDLIYQGAVL